MTRLLILILVALGPAKGSARSVYDVSLAKDLPILASASAAALIPYAFASRWIDPRCPCDAGEIPGFDRGAVGNNSGLAVVVSDVGLVTAVVAPVALDALDVGLSSTLVEDLVVYTEAILVAGALVSLTKVLVQRPLPRVYAGQAPELVGEPEGYRSFYSGHATVAFSALGAAAVTLQLRYQPGIWPWVAASGLGSLVALGRVAGGLHFLSDVVVGAAAGLAVGIVVPVLHRASGIRISAYPLPGGSLVAARLSL